METLHVAISFQNISDIIQILEHNAKGEQCNER